MPHRPVDVRNVAIVGPVGSGKTTLVEAALFVSKVVSRKGTVEEGNTVSDFDPEERARKHSLSTSVVHLPWSATRVQLLDTPGAMDFAAGAASAMAAVETVAIALPAHDGVGVTARRRFVEAGALGLVRVVVLTKIDQENIDEDRLKASLRENFGEHVIPLDFPDVFGPGVTRIYDIFADHLPDAEKRRALDLRKQVTEAVVECDDRLLERYLAGGEITQDELFHAFPKAIREGHLVPVLHTSAKKELGIREFLDFLAHETPAPSEGVVRPARTAVGQPVKVEPSGPFSAQVFQIVNDAHIGKLALLRVFSGTLVSKATFTVARTGNVERFGDLLEIQGKDWKPVHSVSVGDIVGVSKVESLRVGDTVTAPGAGFAFDPISFPRPTTTLAIEPKNRADEAKLAPELHKLMEADPTFVAERDVHTGEFVARGLSGLHLAVSLGRLARKHIEVLTHPPRVAYRETVSAKGEGEFRHKKQSGGHGQFAEVHLRVEPLPRGEGFEFVDAIVGGTIPRQFVPAVEKGVREALAEGALAGYPVTDVRATVHFGKFHDVDSDEHSFKIAASQAFRAAFEAGRPVLLEPIVDAAIDVPSRFMGAISGDVNARRGRISGVETTGDHTTVRAYIPMPEMLDFGTELRSMTAGEGEFRAEIAHFDRVPAPLDEHVIAKHRKARAHAPGVH